MNVGPVKNVRANTEKAKEVVSNIKKDGLVTGVKNTFTKSKEEKPSIASKVTDAINKFKSNT